MRPCIDIVIRSYFRDFHWLRLSLASIHAFLRGYRQILLILPESSADRWKESLAPGGLPLQLVTCVDYADDYLGQQVSKLYADEFSADEFSDADYLVHVDSDCVFVRPTVVRQDLFREEKPIHIYRDKSLRPAVDGWRNSIPNVLGIYTDREFMVTLPAVYPRGIYADLRRSVMTRHNLELSELVLTRRPDRFSEFSVLGAYAFEYMQDCFTWIEAGTKPLPDWPCIHFWGRGCSPIDVAHLLPESLR
jgi:hypothetical protein